MDVKLPDIVSLYIKEVAQKYSKKPIVVAPKNSSTFMKAVGWLFSITKINPKFMTDYITTIGNTIYFPDEMLQTMNPLDMLRIVSHECLHIKDSNQHGLLFSLSYLGPQILPVLSVLSLLAIFTSKFWLLSLLFLLFLAPIPSFGRFYWEKRAYRTSLLFEKFLYNSDDIRVESVREWIAEQLSGSYYYFAWPFKSWIIKDLMTTDFMATDEYKEIENFISQHLIQK